MVRVGIIGASGYAGAEIIRYLLGHPEAEITYLASGTYKGKHIGNAFTSLMGQNLPMCEAFDDTAIDRADIFFVAQHYGWAASIAPKVVQAGKKLIDMSADFRFRNPAVYEQWYKTEHTSKDITVSAAYGLPEIKKDQIAAALVLGNPGCYPTGAILALAPVIANRRVDPSGIIIDSKSGVSGSGRTKTEVAYLFAELDESMKPYGVANHRHTPEIEQEISEMAGQDVVLSFTPHLVPMVRGIMTTTYAPILSDLSTGAAIDLYREFYANSPFVIVLDEGEYPATKNVSGTNFCHIGLKVDSRTGRMIAMSAIDNMGKGAAGQAVQNMNLMMGLPETTGLMHPAVYP